MKIRNKRRRGVVRAPPYAGPSWLAPGARVEARPRNVDELYYGAVVLSRDREKVAGGGATRTTFTVMYDDGDVEEGLSRESLMRFNRRLVHDDAGGDVLVEDGSIVFQGRLRRVRLLQFKGSIGIYQSGVLLSSTLPDRIDPTALPFEVNQLMALGIALHGLVANRRPIRRACFAGLGGGAVPSFFHTVCPSAEVYVIDTSEEVTSVARKCFGLVDAVNVVRCDAFDWLSSTAMAFDLVVVDVADPADRFLPPKRFLDAVFLKRIARAPNAVCVMNSLAAADAPDHCVQMAQTFTEAFPSTAYSAMVDPNRVFFACNTILEEDITAGDIRSSVSSFPSLLRGIPGIYDLLKYRGDSFWRKVEPSPSS